MKGLILVALVGFALAITLAIPFTEDEIKAYKTQLGEIRNDVTQSNLESEDDDYVDSDDNEEDEDAESEDEDEDDEDEDDDDDDDDDADGRVTTRSNPVQQSSDPAWGVLPLFRGVRRLARRFRRRRRRRRRGRRVGRWFRRRRSRG